MDECLDDLGNEIIFSGSHSRQGQWQVEVQIADQDKNKFNSFYALYRFNHKQLTLCNVPVTIQLVMHVILSPVELQYTLDY